MIIMSIRLIMWSLCTAKVLYVYYVDYVHFMLIVYIIMFMHIRLIMMSVLQVMHIMYIRDIPNIYNVFITHKALEKSQGHIIPIIYIIMHNPHNQIMITYT